MTARGLVTLAAAVGALGLDAAAATAAIEAGDVLVDGVVVDNPRSMVNSSASVRLASAGLRGRQKLGWALSHFGVDVSGRVALDVGACTGGFTAALLDGGAARVYAVDAGHGQLLASLRRDGRVVNLERTNVGSLNRVMVPEPISVVTIDVSYLALSAAVAQASAAVELGDGAALLGLVKPMFELGLATIPTDASTLADAARRAAERIAACGWDVAGCEESPVRGHRGAVEFFLHARR